MIRTSFLIVMIILLPLCSFYLSAQDRKIDKLEVFYDQGYYRKTLRKSKRLLNKPDYDYSAVPKLFKALSLFKLTLDQRYKKRHPKAFDEAVRNLEIFINQDVKGLAYTAHRDKILEIQVQLAKKSLALKKRGRSMEADKIAGVIQNYFKGNKSLEGLPMTNVEKEVPVEKEKDPKENEKEDASEEITVSSSRDEVISYAKKYLGVKYRYGGTDENGFDCSGYIGHVMKQFDIFLPRTSRDQYSSIKKIKKNKVEKGDLVFFGGGKVNHVGIICSDPGEELHMIHASTSIGVSIVNIEQSSYWKPRIKGYGRVIND